jgi:ElaB/YqjD/DUF883 family membrane-anchored ribosome-binding protein
MPDNIKERIQSDLQQAKQTGQLRSDRIREIVRAAVSQVASEFKEGSAELRTLVKDAVSTVVDKGSEIKEEVTASIEGAIEAVNSKRHEAIAKTQAEVQQLQAKLDEQEDKIQQEVEGILAEIKETSNEKSSSTKTAIDSAVQAIQDSEEVTLLKKRYAQLQGQLAIARANITARYGGRSQEVQRYLDDAKNWFNKARPQAEVVVTQVQEKHSQIDEKLGEAGTALAKKERQIRQILRDLLFSAADRFKDKDSVKDKETVNK